MRCSSRPTGVALLKRPDERQQTFTRPPPAGAQPAVHIGTRSKKDPHASVAGIRLNQPAACELAAGSPFVERRRRRLEERGPTVLQPTRLLLTFGIAVEAALENAAW